MSIFGGGSSTPASSVSPSYAGVQVQTALAGASITVVYGTTLIAPNLIWYGDFQAIAQYSQSSSSGKGGGGGGGGGGSQITGYNYTASVAMGLCVGPILGIGTVWESQTATSLANLGAGLFAGGSGQAPWSYLSSNYPTQAVGYSGLAYVVAANLDMGSSATLSNYNFEVAGLGVTRIGADADPGFCITDILTNASYGAGMASSMVASTTNYSAWCTGQNLLISPALDSQTALRDTLTDWLDATQAGAVWSAGKLKIIPYADCPSGTYVPNLTPVMSFTDNDYLPADNDPPVKIIRADPADLYNQFTVEYLDRSNDYNTSTVNSEDDANIAAYGIRPEGSQSWHFITTATAAQTVVDMRRNRILGVLATYEWRIGDLAALLEPMDIVAITDTAIGLSAYPVRVTKIEESDDGVFTVTAEDMPGLSLTDRPVASLSGYAATYGQTPSSVNAPVLFEPPDALTTTGLELWAAVSGDGIWGGCQVYVSDDGISYSLVGSVTSPARQGTLMSPLTVGLPMDTVNVATVAMTGPGQLLSGTLQDAQSLNTLCWVDGELLAYQTAKLVNSGIYQLSTLVRGAQGSAITRHAAGAPWCRLDKAIFKYPFTASRIGQTLYLKFVSFNVWGAGAEDIANVHAYAYTLQGSALASPLPNVIGLTTVYVAGITQLSWQPVSDFRSVDYEVRQGPSWTAGQVIGRTPLTQMPSYGDGTYWVAAHYKVPNGVDVYSAAPAEVVLAGSQLVSNVIARFDQAALGWPGTATGLVVVGGALELAPQGDVATAADVSVLEDVSCWGGMLGSGTYNVPPSHRVNVGRVASCQVLISVTLNGQSIYDDISQVLDLSQIVDVSGSANGQFVSAVPQIRLSQDGVTWGAWQNWVPGSYTAMAYDFQVVVSSGATQVTAVLSDFTVAVDVPDRTDAYTVSPAAGGAAVTYASPFNGGPNAMLTPAISAAIVAGGAPGDTVQMSATALSGCSVTVYNAAGTPVGGRTCHLIVQGY